MTRENARILIVDDQPANREILEDQLAILGHKVEHAASGPDALMQLRQDLPDLMLLDIMMPQMDGHEVLVHMKQNPNTQHIPVIVVSALDEMDSVVRCIAAGAEDYLTKPIKVELLRARIESCLEKKHLRDEEIALRKRIEDHNHNLEQRVRDQVARTSKAHLATIFAMSKLAESRDPETGEHLERMRLYCKLLAEGIAHTGPYAQALEAGFVDNIYCASPLHDIGKVGIPDRILLKPGKLTSDEFDIIKRHPRIGAETLRAVVQECPDNAFIRMGIEIAEYHHEKWDGSGYPNGLAGEDIPLSARILALGDVYDALTSSRCYKEAFSHERSCAIIEEGAGAHFDPVLVDAFRNIESRFVEIRNSIHDSEKMLVT